MYCEDLTSAGMTDCLRILKKGSKSGRHKSMLEDGEDDTDDDDDILEDDEDGELAGDGEKPKQVGTSNKIHLNLYNIQLLEIICF